MGTNPPSVDSQSGQHRSSLRHSSAMASPSPSNSSARLSQADLKSHILREFDGATFTVDLTAEGATLQADESDVQNVLDRLRSHYNVTASTLLGNDASTEDAPRFPPKGFAREKSSYTPLTHFLNIITRAAKECMPSPGYLSNLRFESHGAAMRDIVESEKSLKPDVLGLLHPPTSRPEKISWRDVAIVVEVKRDRHQNIQQLATYARCYLAVDRRRSFSIVIAFNHDKLQMHFLIFHRSGLSASRQLSLTEETGFQSVVQHMVGILSISDEEAFGLDMTRFGNIYRINNRDYEIVRTIYVRRSVRGRATSVYSLRVCPSGTQDIPTTVRSRMLTLVDGMPQLPEKIVYKLSYQPEGQTSEGTLFSGSFGQFGIVDICGFHICGAEESFGSTVRHLRNSTFLQLADSEESIATPPENRTLHCTAMALECLPLLDISDEIAGIPKPAELLETLLHAMIGHYNLFLGGVLHRDVSHGNILRLQEPINRTRGHSMAQLRSVLSQDIDLVTCRGFLADGDHSIELHMASRTPSLERSGTLPFMSMHLLDAWYHGDLALHTALDDLESFLWVLVWSLVHIFAKSTSITNKRSTNSHIIHDLSSFDISDVIRKEHELQSWRDVVFDGLIKEWLSISQDSRKIVLEVETTLSVLEYGSDAQRKILEELQVYCEGIYIKFIQAGFRHLEEIRNYSSWNAVVVKNAGLLNK